MALCDVCESISFLDLPCFPDWFRGSYVPIEEEDLVPYLVREPADDKEREARKLGIPYHTTLESLQKAAKSCKLCQQVNVGVTRVLECLEIANRTDHYQFRDTSGGPSFTFYICKRESGGDGFVVLSPAKNNSEVFLMAVVGFCAEYDSPAAEHMSGRVVLQDRKDSRVQQLIQSWLLTCDHEHNHPRSTQNMLPARVVSVGHKTTDSTRVTLWEPPAGTPGSYAVFNHARGLSASFPMTQRKRQEYKTGGIPISDLPEAFENAVWMTRELGLPYLWIDDLCVDQEEHGEHGLDFAGVDLYDVYTQSSILLSAVGSKTDSEVFLSTKTPCAYTPLHLEINGKTTTIFGFAILPAYEYVHGKNNMSMPDEPLSLQAWSFQAHQLAPRKLYFGTNHISFECSSLFVNERGFRSDKPCNTLQFTYPEYKDSLDARNEVWKHIVLRYGPLQIPRPSDKLIALSGMAKAVQKIGGGENIGHEYIAGLWRDNILEGLCWQSIGDEGNRPPTYRAPSWSWASIDCNPGLTRVGFIELANVEEVHVDLKTESKYGEVTGGYIRLTAPLIRVIKSELPEKDHMHAPPQRLVRLVMEGDENNYGHYTKFDVPAEIDRNRLHERELYFVPLTSWAGSCTRGDCGSTAFVLVVEPWYGAGSLPNGTLCYRRLGWVMSDFGDKIYDWVVSKDNGELSTITLV